VVEQLLRVPAINANAAEADGLTPLHLAAQEGHQGVVKQLLGVPGMNANAAGAGGFTPCTGQFCMSTKEWWSSC
jgi:ankyrin repeat protein